MTKHSIIYHMFHAIIFIIAFVIVTLFTGTMSVIELPIAAIEVSKIEGSSEEKYYTIPELLAKSDNSSVSTFAEKFSKDFPNSIFVGEDVQHLNNADNHPVGLFFAPTICAETYTLSDSVTRNVREFNQLAISLANYADSLLKKHKIENYQLYLYVPTDSINIIVSPGIISIPPSGSLRKCRICVTSESVGVPPDHVIVKDTSNLMDTLFTHYKNKKSKMAKMFVDWDRQLSAELSIVEPYAAYLTSMSPRLPINPSYKFTKSFTDDEQMLGMKLIDIKFIESYDPSDVYYPSMPPYIDGLKSHFPKITFHDKSPLGARHLAIISHDPSYVPGRADSASVRFKIPDTDGLTEAHDGYLHILPYTFTEELQLFVGDLSKKTFYDNTKIREQLFRVNVCQRDYGYFDSYFYASL